MKVLINMKEIICPRLLIYLKAEEVFKKFRYKIFCKVTLQLFNLNNKTCKTIIRSNSNKQKMFNSKKTNSNKSSLLSNL